MNEKDAIVATALDYFEGWYDADLDRVDRALHPQLVKRRPAEVSGENPSVTTKQMMLDYVREGGGAADKTDDPIEVDVDRHPPRHRHGRRAIRAVPRVPPPAPHAGRVADRRRVLAVHRT